jgi:hypothetical protein
MCGLFVLGLRSSGSRTRMILQKQAWGLRREGTLQSDRDRSRSMGRCRMVKEGRSPAVIQRTNESKLLEAILAL